MRKKPIQLKVALILYNWDISICPCSIIAPGYLIKQVVSSLVLEGKMNSKLDFVIKQNNDQLLYCFYSNKSRYFY